MTLYWCPIHRWESIHLECPHCKKEEVKSSGLSYVDRIERKLDAIVQLLSLLTKSCEKNPADAQPETGVAEPGK